MYSCDLCGREYESQAAADACPEYCAGDRKETRRYKYRLIDKINIDYGE